MKLLLLLWLLGLAALSAAIINLGSASTFAALGSSALTNTGPTVLDGDIGVSPGELSSITGFPPGLYTGNAYGGSSAAGPHTDATTAYNTIASMSEVTVLTGDLGGMTLVPGTYKYTSSAQLTGDLTLLGNGSTSDAWYFQIGSSFTTATEASITYSGFTPACSLQIGWQIGSSATLGTGSLFLGDIFAAISITMATGATIGGRLFALAGAITLDSNFVEPPPLCPVPSTTLSLAASATSILSQSIGASGGGGPVPPPLPTTTLGQYPSSSVSLILFTPVPSIGLPFSSSTPELLISSVILPLFSSGLQEYPSPSFGLSAAPSSSIPTHPSPPPSSSELIISTSATKPTSSHPTATDSVLTTTIFITAVPSGGSSSRSVSTISSLLSTTSQLSASSGNTNQTSSQSSSSSSTSEVVSFSSLSGAPSSTTSHMNSSSSSSGASVSTSSRTNSSSSAFSLSSPIFTRSFSSNTSSTTVQISLASTTAVSTSSISLFMNSSVVYITQTTSQLVYKTTASEAYDMGDLPTPDVVASSTTVYSDQGDNGEQGVNGDQGDNGNAEADVTVEVFNTLFATVPCPSLETTQQAAAAPTHPPCEACAHGGANGEGSTESNWNSNQGFNGEVSEEPGSTPIGGSNIGSNKWSNGEAHGSSNGEMVLPPGSTAVSALGNQMTKPTPPFYNSTDVVTGSYSGTGSSTASSVPTQIGSSSAVTGVSSGLGTAVVLASIWGLVTLVFWRHNYV
ncbi:hypothetical protein LSUE1_G000594 [Lachnellula suecica]|uniref:Ice-binding protein n=1 Tax=Lachnellula suecica TaxID=602035 RepID=A0A8T9CGU7_9HELO|nr:hypothetical protein LSUE1_G000594 [Lachnellula suecica]